jgi:hypothetical protein
MSTPDFTSQKKLEETGQAERRNKLLSKYGVKTKFTVADSPQSAVWVATATVHNSSYSSQSSSENSTPPSVSLLDDKKIELLSKYGISSKFFQTQVKKPNAVSEPNEEAIRQRLPAEAAKEAELTRECRSRELQRLAEETATRTANEAEAKQAVLARLSELKQAVLASEQEFEVRDLHSHLGEESKKKEAEVAAKPEQARLAQSVIELAHQDSRKVLQNAFPQVRIPVPKSAEPETDLHGGVSERLAPGEAGSAVPVSNTGELIPYNADVIGLRADTAEFIAKEKFMYSQQNTAQSVKDGFTSKRQTLCYDNCPCSCAIH